MPPNLECYLLVILAHYSTLRKSLMFFYVVSDTPDDRTVLWNSVLLRQELANGGDVGVTGLCGMEYERV